LIHVSLLGGIVDGDVVMYTFGGEAWESFEIAVINCLDLCRFYWREKTRMIKMDQLLCVVAIIETASNRLGFGHGVVIEDFEVGSPSVVDDANPLKAMTVVTPPSENDFAV
jgi:hypothetical protein